MARSTKSSRLKTNTSKTNDTDGEKHTNVPDKQDSAQTLGLKKKEEKAESPKTTSASGTPSRRPYKIRPVERVRTRGYSLLLASKLALKRAKKDSVSHKQRSDMEGHVDEVKGKKPASQGQGDYYSGKNRKTGERKHSVSMVDVDSGQRDKGDKSKNSEAGTESAILTRSIKDGSEKSKTSSSSSKGSTLKRSKSATSGTSSHSHSQANSQFPSIPTFLPSEEEFTDPLAYITKIQPLAEPFGICSIIPPNSWKLDSTKINEDIRFTPQVQHIHRLYQRWGPNVQHRAAISQHLLSELYSVNTTPQIGGVEIDLYQLYQLVEEAGGPRELADKKHWARIADLMNIPKQAMDRTMRLYDIYCRYVFPYASLSEEEKKQLEAEVNAIHRLQTMEDDAVLKGKSMSVSWFSKIASNVRFMWFKEEPSPAQVEAEYWSIVEDRKRHVAVQCAHVNTRTQASAFPTRRDSVYSRHPWNLNNVTENSNCLLKYLGLIAGITIPTLHMGMLFSTSCWSTDPHSLPYIQYLHTGAELIWYCVPKSENVKLCRTMKDLVPSLISDKPRWLKEDCVMINPRLFKEKGIRVSRCVQRARQFVVVFPGAYTATISCGYSVAESVHYANTSWLSLGMEASQALTASGEKELFSLSALLCGLVQDEQVEAGTLAQALPIFDSVVSKEIELRSQLAAAGLVGEKSDVFIEAAGTFTSHRKRSSAQEEEKVCELCDRVCHLSMVLNEQDEQVLCLEHGLKHVYKKKNLKSTRLFLRYSQIELEKMVKDSKDRLTSNASRSDLVGLSLQGSKTRTITK